MDIWRCSCVEVDDERTESAVWYGHVNVVASVTSPDAPPHNLSLFMPFPMDHVGGQGGKTKHTTPMQES